MSWLLRSFVAQPSAQICMSLTFSLCQNRAWPGVVAGKLSVMGLALNWLLLRTPWANPPSPCLRIYLMDDPLNTDHIRTAS